MEHINRLWTAIVHGVTESAAYHTVALIHGEPKDQELATGTAVSFRGHQFIVTAAHVIGDWTDEIYMILRPEGPYAILPTPSAELRLLRFHELDRTRTAPPIGTKMMILVHPVKPGNASMILDLVDAFDGGSVPAGAAGREVDKRPAPD